METINWKKIQKSDLLNQLDNENIPKLTTKTYKDYFSKFEDGINKLDFLTSRNLLMVLLWNDSQKTFLDIKKKGIFRATKQLENNKQILVPLLNDLIATPNIISKLDHLQIVYLESVLNFLKVLPSLKKCQTNVLNEFKFFKKKYSKGSFIKTLMAWNDYLFVSSHFPDFTNTLIQSQTKEELSEAVSYLIYKYLSVYKDDSTIGTYIEASYLSTSEFENLIVNICTFIDIKEKEISIDFFDYKCIHQEGRLIIQPPFDDFEKSLRLGYIRTDIQYLNDKLYELRIFEESNGLTFQNLVNQLSSINTLQFVYYNHTFDYPRYSFMLDEIINEKILVDFLGKEKLFVEEYNYLRILERDYHLDYENLNRIKIKENLSLYEFIIIKRYFVFMFFAFSYEVFKSENNRDTVISSLVPVIPITQIYKILNPLIEQNKVDSFLELLCWERDSNHIFDLQYSPIYKSKGFLHISLSVLANSNQIRNVYASEYSKDNNSIMSDGKKDLLVDKLEKYFNTAGIKNHTQIVISDTDIDVLAYFDSTLFIFECKNGLHPVNNFDLRGTYNHIKKAEKQLSKIQKEYSNGKLAQVLKSRFDIELDSIQTVSYSIILGNRLFNGNIFDYPVRYISEIGNIIKTGNIHTAEGTFCIWEENKITAKVLLDYLSTGNVFFKMFDELINKITISKKFYDTVIEMDTYEISIEDETMSSIVQKHVASFRKMSD